MDFAKTIILTLSALFIAMWIGIIVKAEGEDKYIEACRPVTIGTKYLMKISTGLTGFTPLWTVKVKEIFDGGCYYFFASFMFNENLGEGTEQNIIQDSRAGGEQTGGGLRY